MKEEALITEQDAQRFRLALLRAKLVRLGQTFDADADESMLERQLRFAERRRQSAASGLPDGHPGTSDNNRER